MWRCSVALAVAHDLHFQHWKLQPDNFNQPISTNLSESKTSNLNFTTLAPSDDKSHSLYDALTLNLTAKQLWLGASVRVERLGRVPFAMTAIKDITRALAKVRAAIPAQKQAVKSQRDIRLGLERISRIVTEHQPWIGVHVGGTNGKGSIVALLAGLLKLEGVSYGTYMSPALPERHNGVAISGSYVNKRMYEQEIAHVQAKYARVASGFTYSTGEDPGDLSPFELETATAFRIFTKMNVKYGVVEVGMGGATDATNAMQSKAVTVISKIGLDHQEYLGDTLEKIARVKAGIMRRKVPCIVDHTNPPQVLDTLRRHAEEVGTQLVLSRRAMPQLETLDQDKYLLEEYEKENLLCALEAFRTLFPGREPDLNRLFASQPYPPGRKELVSIAELTNGRRPEPVLVDGAHNLLGAQNFAQYVNRQIRKGDGPVTWVLGFSAGGMKPFAEIMEALLQPQDNLAFVEYDPEPQVPEAVPASIGRDAGRSLVTDEVEQVYEGEANIKDALNWATEKAADGPVIVTGSLYLIRQLYDLDGVTRRDTQRTRAPGRAQLWYYTQLAQKRPLTEAEDLEFHKAYSHWYHAEKKKQKKRAANKEDEPGVVLEPLSAEGMSQRRKLHQEADLHRVQAEGYNNFLQTISKDTATAVDDVKAAAAAVDVAEVERMRDWHKEQHQRLLLNLGHESAAPGGRFLTREEITGYTKKKSKGAQTQSSNGAAAAEKAMQEMQELNAGFENLVRTSRVHDGSEEKRPPRQRQPSGPTGKIADNIVDKLIGGKE